jgi:hypothetical protein
VGHVPEVEPQELWARAVLGPVLLLAVAVVAAATTAVVVAASPKVAVAVPTISAE